MKETKARSVNERTRPKTLGVRFTVDEIAEMSDDIGMEYGEIPDATVVGTFVRRKLTNKNIRRRK